jgi:hypothetical protein
VREEVQRPPAVLIQSEMRCTTAASPCGDIPSQGSERLAIWLLVTVTSSLRGECVTALRAQQKPMPVIGKAELGSRVPVVGVLLYEPPEPAFAAFREKFREIGYEEGPQRSARDPVGRCAARAASGTDVIIPWATAATRAAIDATKQIPTASSLRVRAGAQRPLTAQSSSPPRGPAKAS